MLQDTSRGSMIFLRSNMRSRRECLWCHYHWSLLEWLLLIISAYNMFKCHSVSLWPRLYYLPSVLLCRQCRSIVVHRIQCIVHISNLRKIDEFSNKFNAFNRHPRVLLRYWWWNWFLDVGYDQRSLVLRLRFIEFNLHC